MIRIGLVLSVAVVVTLNAWSAIDLTSAVVVKRTGDAPAAEGMAVEILVDEIFKRTGVRLSVATELGSGSAQIIILSNIETSPFLASAPDPLKRNLETLKAEGFCIYAVDNTVWIAGADGRGAMFGAGYLLRKLDLGENTIALSEDIDIVTSPQYPIRGHQIGYRNTANSYDAWTPDVYEQYIRDMIVFGTNSIENIPFHDGPSPHFPVPRDEMNLKLSEFCKKYDVNYWMWVPADYNLEDPASWKEGIEENRLLYEQCSRIDAIFIPGGDPGHNHPKLVMPFMEELAGHLNQHHPYAKMWISLQGFEPEWVDYFYEYVEEKSPDWLGGVVAGPSSPPIPETRRRLPKKYGLRHYPDITHTVRCQYPVPWLDPVFGFTLGREPVNPQPVYYTVIHNAFAPYTEGFITYSDGMHDDLNKMVWSALGWDSNYSPYEIVKDYARYFFGYENAAKAADGIFALERNWEGAVSTNGGIEATFSLWRELEESLDSSRNWRVQLYMLRAYYDAYIRKRLLYETQLEAEANEALLQAGQTGANEAMNRAFEILNLADAQNCAPELYYTIEDYCDRLFHSIGFQTSVEEYQASGSERGAVWDFVNHPLNNRWWLEDQFKEIASLDDESEKVKRLHQLATWENPGPGSFYDDIGNVAKSPHVIRGEGINTDPNMERNPNPDLMWWENGKTRVRPSWISKMDWPLGHRYTALDPDAEYFVRVTGYGEALLKIDGQRATPTVYNKEIGGFKEFPVPDSALEDGEIILTWDVPDERHLNWRQQSRLNELWLIKVSN